MKKKQFDEHIRFENFNIVDTGESDVHDMDSVWHASAVR